MALSNESKREEVLFSPPGTKSTAPLSLGEEKAAGEAGGET